MKFLINVLMKLKQMYLEGVNEIVNSHEIKEHKLEILYPKVPSEEFMS